MRYYLKKCSRQEMGSIKDGIPQRGRYLYISKNPEIMSLFPPLSATEQNDKIIVPIIPFYSGKKVYCIFDYHNSKITQDIKGGRNEYRIYLTKELEDSPLKFKENDIVIIRIDEKDSDDEKEKVYLLDLLQDHTADLYRRLNEIIENTNIRGGHGFTDRVIPEFEEKAALLKKTPASKVVIDDKVIEQIKNQKEAIADLFTFSSFRDFVLVSYNYLCAVTGTVIRHDDFMNIEAAHIKPRSHKGSNAPNNGIALCRDLHWAFDKGFFTINKKYEITVHPDITSEYLRSFNGKKINLPHDEFFRPSPENIEYHNKNIYGLFLTSGRL